MRIISSAAWTPTGGAYILLTILQSLVRGSSDRVGELCSYAGRFGESLYVARFASGIMRRSTHMWESRYQSVRGSAAAKRAASIARVGRWGPVNKRLIPVCVEPAEYR